MVPPLIPKSHNFYLSLLKVFEILEIRLQNVSNTIKDVYAIVMFIFLSLFTKHCYLFLSLASDKIKTPASSTIPTMGKKKIYMMPPMSNPNEEKRRRNAIIAYRNRQLKKK